jgi:hypothetical protein
MDKEEIKDGGDKVEHFAKDIELSEKRDKLWCQDAKYAIKTYRNEHRIGEQDQRKDSFNILWANVETLRPALYSQVPKPDIRRRFRQTDVMGRHVSEILEHAATYCLEEYGMDNAMVSAVNDMLLPGRGTTRIKYEADITDAVYDNDENETEPAKVESERLKLVPWEWEKILLGPGEQWEELPWIAFIHQLDRDQIKELAPDFVDKILFDIAAGQEEEGSGNQTGKKVNERVDKRATVYEIWCKGDKTVKWYALDYKDSFIKEEDDPLSLKDFWPIPKPLYSIESTTSMVPITEFSQYETLAKNLEIVTVRMARITDSLRVRGIYDGTLSEMQKLFEAGDNHMIPAENLARLIESGGIAKSIWMFPNQELSNVLLQLYQYRQQTIGQIYEITGISDIMRGQSDPYETLGAQKMKGNFGSQRLQKRQREVQRYARDVLRLVVEVIAEKFTAETLEGITGLKYPTNQDKQEFQMQQQMQAAQMQAQMQQMQQQAMMTGQQPPEPPQPPEVDPETQRFINLPSWEDLKEVMESDLQRSYMIGIETDSTVQADQNADQQALTLLLGGIGQFTQAMVPTVQSGVIDKEAAKSLLKSILKRFRLGREVEEAIENSMGDDEAAQQEQQAQQQQQQQLQAQQQAEQQRQQAEMQAKQAEAQANQAKYAHEAQMRQLDAQAKQAEHTQTMRELQLKGQLAEAKAAQEMQKMRMSNETDQG